ncbi:hypothetical protein MF271_19090 (plasmid) [Deinococcus sp. KNUC1210]|uniref:hypothetical protein n=1 Tax=Deinococcus sp. KNUC1210 TaxID=2917691 RepID=UPI001EEFC6FB|nr:hypothetical protein [Deinococcus sp. KNUC1210]ULH17427.1 hypothetical protein MF271_19090 [Deinococcus sp. KNUC1210]
MNRLPDIEKYVYDHDLNAVVRDHIDASEAVKVLGEPQAWTLAESGSAREFRCAMLKWVTPEGWEVGANMSFNWHGVGRQRGYWEGPWASGVVFRQDGFELANELTDALALVLENMSYTVENMRLKKAEWNWKPWYGEADDE